MQLPEEMTTSTPVAKVLWILCFLMIPFIGFFGGVRYQEFIATPTLDAYTITQDNPYPDQTYNNQQLYTNLKYGISFFSPPLDQTCCDIPGPLNEKFEKIIVLADKSSVSASSDSKFNGVGLYVVTLPPDMSFNLYMRLQKKSLLDNYIKTATMTPSFSENTYVVGQKQGVVLHNYSWWSPEIIFVPFDTTHLLAVFKNEISPGSFDSTFNQVLKSIHFSKVTLLK